jgi:hypothetical protein
VTSTLNSGTANLPSKVLDFLFKDAAPTPGIWEGTTVLTFETERKRQSERELFNDAVNCEYYTAWVVDE